MRLEDLPPYVPTSPIPHQWSRRDLLRTAGAAGALVAAGALRPLPALARSGALPPSPGRRDAKPIPTAVPGSLFGDPANTHLYHTLPVFAPVGGQYIEVSTITDFRGAIAAANVNGTGHGTPRPGNADGRYDFNVDMRFMRGQYIGVDGHHHVAAWGFI
jgi:hypothetical protein